MTGRLTAGALVLLAVAGCTSAPSPPPAAAPATAGSPAPDCPAAGLPPLLVIGGPDLFDAELQRYDLCTATGTRVGELRRYSAISAAGGHVAVANAAAGPDSISLLQGEALVPLGGLGTPQASVPAVATDGTVAFREVLDLSEPGAFQVSIWSPDRPDDKRVVVRADVPTSPLAFGPGRTLAVVRNSDELIGATGPPTLTLHDAETGSAGATTELPLQQARGVVWGPEATRIAVTGEDDAAGVLLDSTTLAVTGRIPAGFYALTFTPDARQLLLVRSAGRPNGSGELALLTVEDQRLQPLPPFAGGVVGGAAWP